MDPLPQALGPFPQAMDSLSQAMDSLSQAMDYGEVFVSNLLHETS